MTNEEEIILRRQLSTNEARDDLSAWAIVGALLFEVCILLYFSRADDLWETALLILANVTIAAGVWGEIKFGGKARRIAERLQQHSDEKIAEANARAKEADQKSAETKLEFLKFRQPRREVIAGKTASLTSQLTAFKGTSFDCALAGESGEQADFWWDLQPALVDAGWNHIPWNDNSPNRLVQGHRPPSGAAAAKNVEIHIHPSDRPSLAAAATALVSTLKSVGIDALDVGFNCHSTNTNTIHILIGDKW